MQTFLPYSNFAMSAEVLDNRRLNKQITEVFQLINSINEGNGWSNHPASKMWRKHVSSLIEYGLICYEEWQFRHDRKERGGVREHLSGERVKAMYKDLDRVDYPEWLGDNEFHSSHRAALLFKNLEYYSQFGWYEEPKIEYVWPICLSI